MVRRGNSAGSRTGVNGGKIQMVVDARGGREGTRVVVRREEEGTRVETARGVGCRWLFWFIDDPLPFLEVKIPPCRHRVPVKEALPLKQRTECENLHPPPLQLIGYQIIRCDGDDNRFPPVAGQLDIGIEHPRPRPLREIMQGPGHGPCVVEDVVTVDVGDGAFEAFAGAPFEELVFVD